MGYDCTHLTAEGDITHSVAHRSHWTHFIGSICQTVPFRFAR